MKRCPECLSTVEETDLSCPQCDASFASKKSGGTLLFMTAVLILAGAGGWYFLQEQDPTASLVASQAEETASRDPTSRDGSIPISTPQTEPNLQHHLRLVGEDGETIFGLVIAGSSNLIFLPLADLPLRGELSTLDSILQIEVATYDRGQGFALLTTDGMLPESVMPLALGDLRSLTIGAALPGITTSGQLLPAVEVLARDASGKLILARRLPRGSALLDQQGGVVAYALGGSSAMSLEGLGPWIGYRGGRPLEQVQAELRAQDPSLVFQKARRLLLAEDYRSALEVLRSGSALARDQDAILAFATLERRALRGELRELARKDPVAAIALAREALVSYPDHYPLLADAVQIMVARGDPLEAIGLYRQLQDGSPEHARATVEALTKGLQARGGKLTADGRYREGLVLLARAKEILPGRADLHMSYAEALSSAGQHLQALAAAEQAAVLDPAYLRELAGYRQRTATEPRPDRAEIPFDPATNVIMAEVRIGGLPLELIVDTGASMTIVPTSLARQLGLIGRNNRLVQVHTASGMATGVLVRLPELRIGELRLANLRAIAMDLPNSMEGKGLLGMNALRRLQVRIDSEGGRLILERKR